MSHDRDFLTGLVEKVYEFGNKKVTEHLEDIQGFLRKKKMENLKEIERKAWSLPPGSIIVTDIHCNIRYNK